MVHGKFMLSFKLINSLTLIDSISTFLNSPCFKEVLILSSVIFLFFAHLILFIVGPLPKKIYKANEMKGSNKNRRVQISTERGFLRSKKIIASTEITSIPYITPMVQAGIKSVKNSHILNLLHQLFSNRKEDG